MSQNYDQFAGKRVIVVHRVDGKTDAEEVEGTAEAANDQAILLKPKGKTQLQLIEAGNIEDVRFVEDKPKALARKTLKVVQFGQARNHLLERHAFTLSQVNEMSEQEALEKHEGIDHEASDLGHVHGDKDATPRAEAVEAAAS